MSMGTTLFRPATVAIGAAFVGLAAIGVPLPASASAATTSAPAGADCTMDTEKNVIPGSQDKYRQRVICATIPSGVNAGFSSSGGWDVWTASSAANGPATTDWGDWTSYVGVRTEPEYRADPKTPGTACTAEIVTTIERSLKYDEHAAKVTCSAINPLIQVRVRGNYNLQGDTLSDWMTAAGTAQTPGQTRTSAIMPVAQIEYALR